jgi:aminoglycoside phosphotransferase (APT) family kinase protein
MSDTVLHQTIERFIATQAGAQQVTLTRFNLLSGGAIQENWALDAEIIGGPFSGTLAAVLRADAPTQVALSHGRAQEFSLFKAAFDAGVKVPEPLWLGNAEVIGRPFFIMRRLAGTAAGHRLVRDPLLGGDRVLLAEQLGEELARIHSIQHASGQLSFLEKPRFAPAATLIRRARDYLDSYVSPHPILEWGLRWLQLNQSDCAKLVLCHRDFRTGNYMVDGNGLTGVLDWEFAGWGDALEDIGWFCAKCWRFGNNSAEAGGIGAREDFYRGYERVAGAAIPHARVKYWEVMAHVNWAIIALQQAQRHLSGEETSLNLALTGQIVPELEWEILNLTEGV